MSDSTTVTVGLDVHARSIRLAAVRADELLDERTLPYDEEQLRAWAGRLRDVDVPLFAYFRHEDEPTAPAYAGRLLELLAQ